MFPRRRAKSDPHRVLLVDHERTHFRLVATTIRERFPDAAVYSADSAARALELLSCRRFDLVLVEAGLRAGADETASKIAGSEPETPVKVLDIAPSHDMPSDGALAMPLRIAEVMHLVEQHRKG